MPAVPPGSPRENHAAALGGQTGAPDPGKQVHSLVRSLPMIAARNTKTALSVGVIPDKNAVGVNHNRTAVIRLGLEKSFALDTVRPRKRGETGEAA